MKFVAVEEIAAPIDQLWPHVADFESFEERAAQRIGAITRTPPGMPGEGTTWRGRTEILGRTRDLTATLTRVERPSNVEIAAVADGIALMILIELAELSPRLTRLTVTTEAVPRGIAGRMILQSAKLARQSLLNRYRSRVAAFAAMVEDNAAMW